MKGKTHFSLLGFVAILIIAGFFVVKKVQAPKGNIQNAINNEQQRVDNIKIPSSDIKQPDTSQNNQQIQKLQTVDPLLNAFSRITKKPFGIFITPKTSPVQPERFSGYHTGTDLEVTPAELNVNVAVQTLCDGELLMARSASGYGGVAVESCTLEGKAVTVIYGHIKLSSITAKIGDQMKAGDFLANLGDAYSAQTDGERKHLHLAVHKGSGINILGYVQSQSALSDWLDPAKYLK